METWNSRLRTWAFPRKIHCGKTVKNFGKRDDMNSVVFCFLLFFFFPKFELSFLFRIQWLGILCEAILNNGT